MVVGQDVRRFTDQPSIMLNERIVVITVSHTTSKEKDRDRSDYLRLGVFCQVVAMLCPVVYYSLSVNRTSAPCDLSRLVVLR